MTIVQEMRKRERMGANRSRRVAGTTLIEILVVIVVFLVGILAVVQIFPGGLKILRQTHNRSIAAQLARNQIELLKGRADQLPDEIVPVRYLANGGAVSVIADPTNGPGNLGFVGANIDGTGAVLDGSGNPLGPWQELSGANVVRRVVGEGSVIPSPKNVGAYYGSMMILQFAPILLRAPYDSAVTVYGNDMDRNDGAPAITDPPLRPYEYFVAQNPPSQPTLFLPSISPAAYRLAVSFYVNTVSGLQKRDLVDGPIVVNAAGNFYALRLDIGDGTNPNPLGIGVGESLAGIDFGSVRVARRFNQIAPAAVFSTTTPYEYKVIDPNLGLILFNPTGYNFKVVTSDGSRVPLRGRVNYDVLDWRIIHDEFRPESQVQHLSLGGIKITTEKGPDGLNEKGLDILVPDGNGGTTHESFVVMDMESGGIVLNAYNGQSLLQLDGTQGVLTFPDVDAQPPYDLTAYEVLPGQTTVTQIHLLGRPLRALYEAKGEWSVQPLKAAAFYSSSQGLPGIAQYYVGASNNLVGGNPTRIYFPQCDVGRKVSVGAIWYTQGGSPKPVLMQDQTFTIHASLSDPLSPLPSIDVRDLDSTAVGFDFSNGYAVRGVTGASVAVRVMWNPSYWVDTSNLANNAAAFGNWVQNWRHETTETYLIGGGL